MKRTQRITTPVKNKRLSLIQVDHNFKTADLFFIISIFHVIMVQFNGIVYMKFFNIVQ
jgi:hypothetical protein